MAFKNKTNTFCYQYLTQISGIKSETIDSLIKCDYDSMHALLAMDVSIDLDPLPNISLGQKSVLRKAIQDLKEIKDQIYDDKHSFLESTKQLLEKSLQEDSHRSTLKRLVTSEMSLIPYKPSAKSSLIPYKSSAESTPKSHELRAVSTKKNKRSLSLVSDDLTYSSVETNKQISTETNTNRKPKTSRGRCDICGDSAKRHASNGKVCNACELFYNSYKDTTTDFICQLNGNCLMNKRTRTNCQSCRWNKCWTVFVAGNGIQSQSMTESSQRLIPIDINESENRDFEQFMSNTDYIKNSQPNIVLKAIEFPFKKSTKESKPKKVSKGSKLCAVCGDVAKGNNFGAVACNGCSIFFSRVVGKQIIIEECVDKTGKCYISPLTRNRCRFCRFRVCCDVGMSKSGKPNPLINGEESEVTNNEVLSDEGLEEEEEV